MKKLMISAVLLVLVLIANKSAHAGWAQAHIIKLVAISDGLVWVQTDAMPSDTCSYWGFNYVMNTNSAAGKQMFSLLLSAKITGNFVELWYDPSSVPGSDHYSGCVPFTMAGITQVGLD